MIFGCKLVGIWNSTIRYDYYILLCFSYILVSDGCEFVLKRSDEVDSKQNTDSSDKNSAVHYFQPESLYIYEVVDICMALYSVMRIKRAQFFRTTSESRVRIQLIDCTSITSYSNLYTLHLFLDHLPPLSPQCLNQKILDFRSTMSDIRKETGHCI